MHKAGVSSPISSKALVSIVALALLAALGFVSVVFLHRQRAFLFDRDDPLGYYVYLRSLLHDRDLSLACFLGYLIIIASWWSWWQGFSFGGRKFLGLTPILVVGLASFLARIEHLPIRRVFPYIFIALLLWNVVLIPAYLSELIPHEGEFSWLEFLLRLRELPDQVLKKMSHL